MFNGVRFLQESFACTTNDNNCNYLVQTSALIKGMFIKLMVHTNGRVFKISLNIIARLYVPVSFFLLFPCMLEVKCL